MESAAQEPTLLAVTSVNLLDAVCCTTLKVSVPLYFSISAGMPETSRLAFWYIWIVISCFFTSTSTTPA